VARNRKRRRTRPPGTDPDPRQGLPTATHDFGAAGSSEHEPENGAAGLEPVDIRSDALDDDLEVDSVEDDEVQAPEDDVEHARQEDDDEGAPPPLQHATPDVELAEEQLAYGRPAEPEPDDEADEDELAATGAAAPEKAPSVFARLIAFLQGSWRELHRVQWPDRRQVFQATGVVIGFVIVAAVFLGVADWVAGKLVTFVLK
jgi:preprotein translocase SecE subunit